ncbi:uncharacterized protein LACBIDRAFT_305351 [Laccaria bicolor S238N-H82]|uniref:Predicted protein n=1 Tax=Laccaria bicolor (strain S238N-H82 / ATCC MYA-4686) TaxID=486041 RepID=B0CU09_LACBS|nr:uncharacterized protein LACBIDRAFT_305351 [Laccaria bicolor S238N-H82]EDR14590.1 predicted protein [Laccaria bicolor S238N-H82]|eukprot:XP_001875149.1 predicted protein [Laccaria bicolor S238N-H82]
MIVMMDTGSADAASPAKQIATLLLLRFCESASVCVFRLIASVLKSNIEKVLRWAHGMPPNFLPPYPRSIPTKMHKTPLAKLHPTSLVTAYWSCLRHSWG